MPHHPPMRPHPRYNPSLSDLDPLSIAVGVGAAAVVWWFFLRQKPVAATVASITPRVQPAGPALPPPPPPPPPGAMTSLERARAYLAAAQARLDDPAVVGEDRAQAERIAADARAKIEYIIANP